MSTGPVRRNTGSKDSYLDRVRVQTPDGSGGDCTDTDRQKESTYESKEFALTSVQAQAPVGRPGREGLEVGVKGPRVREVVVRILHRLLRTRSRIVALPSTFVVFRLLSSATSLLETGP